MCSGMTGQSGDIQEFRRELTMSDSGSEKVVQRTVAYIVELLATAFLTLMAAISTLRLLGILS